MQRTLKGQNAQNRWLEEEIKHHHDRAPEATDDHSPAPNQLNKGDAIRTHLAQLQADPNFAELLRFQEAIRHLGTSPFS